MTEIWFRDRGSHWGISPVASMRTRCNLTDREWSIIQPLLRRKCLWVLRVDDRKVINGIPWRHGPHKTGCNRFVRCQRAGHWAATLRAITEAYDDPAMIDSPPMRVHQHGATAPR